MGGGHRAFDDAKFFVQHLGDGSQAVGGTAGITNDVVYVVVIVVMIHADDKGTIFIFARGGDQHFFGASIHMLQSPFFAGKYPSCFDNQINLPFFPGQVFWIAIRYENVALAL